MQIMQEITLFTQLVSIFTRPRATISSPTQKHIFVFKVGPRTLFYSMYFISSSHMESSKTNFVMANFEENIARIALASLHKLPGKSTLNVSFVCPVCPVYPVCKIDRGYLKKINS